LRSYRLTLPFIALAFFVAIFACNKYKDTPPPSNELPQDKTVTASVQGRVLDENGLPVQGASVTSGTAGTTTDENGVFNFNDISMSSRFGFVKVVKQGYFTGSRSILTRASSSNYVTITLIPRGSKGSFSATSGGSVVVETGDTVAFDASSIVNASTNAAYSGTVHVYAALLDPTKDGVDKRMPGDLRGIGSDGKETMLQSFGMLVVELEGDGGEKLQIAAGKQASLSVKIPDALKANAPAAIPLWYFNDTTGKWIEQGAATRQGDQYCGKTSHFSWWNCDMPYGTVNYKVRLKDQHGNPLAYTYIHFQSQSFFGTLGTYTDSSGAAQGLIPKGVSLVLQVVSECGNLLAGSNVGPALTDQDLGTITVDVESSQITVTGTVVNCTSSPVDSGYVNVNVDGLNYRAGVRAGAYTLTVNRCFSNSTVLKLTAYDFVALKQSEVKTITAVSGDVDAGVLTICDAQVGEFFTFSYNGVSRTYSQPPDSVDGVYLQQLDEITIYAQNIGTPDGTLQFVLQGVTGTGNYPIYYFSYTDATGKTMEGVGANCAVTTYDATGGYFAGTISGNLRNDYAIPTPTVLPISGQFRVKRTW